MCNRSGALLESGFNVPQFIKICKDSRTPCYCDDCDVMDEIIKKLPKITMKAGKRLPMLRTIFEACDVDKDNSLNKMELFRVARCIGFPGDAKEWEDEYSAICSEMGVAKRG